MTLMYRATMTGIIIIALVTRVAYWISWQPPLFAMSGDTPSYDIPAWQLVQGHGYSDANNAPYAHREPGYPIFWLAPIYLVFGHNLPVVSLLQLLLDVLIVISIMSWLRRAINEPTAIVAGIVSVLYLPFIFQSGEILTETVYRASLLLGAWLWYQAINRSSNNLIFLTGLVLGITALIRWGAIVLPVFLVLVAIPLRQSWRRWWWQSIIMMFGVIVVVTPWIARNYAVFGQFIFGRIGGGAIYWSGSNIAGDGDWHAHNQQLTELVVGKTPLEQDKILTQLAITEIKMNPLGVAWIWLKKPFKIYALPDARNYINPSPISTFQTGSPMLVIVLLAITMVHWLLLLAAAISLWQRRLGPILHWLTLGLITFSVLIYLPLNADIRYNVPLMPILIIAASPVLLSWLSRFLGCFRLIG